MSLKEARFELTNESDRGCVLAGAALLEECIEARFRRYFDSRQISKSIQDSLFNSNGPLATFSGKIKLGYAIGLFSRETFNDIEAIRKLRNEAAHVSEDFDFSSKTIRPKLESLKCGNAFKTKLPRYSFPSDSPVKSVATESTGTTSPARGNVHSEARARLAGYIKAPKALFALGIIALQFEIETGLSFEETDQRVAAVKTARGREGGPK
jgi:DNA-binding MltR family transcriptional regulator